MFAGIVYPPNCEHHASSKPMNDHDTKNILTESMFEGYL